jgi:hypothetical protein
MALIGSGELGAGLFASAHYKATHTAKKAYATSSIQQPRFTDDERPVPVIFRGLHDLASSPSDRERQPMRRVLRKSWLGILLAMCLASDATAIISFLAERRDHQERLSQSPSATSQHSEARHSSGSTAQALWPLPAAAAHGAIDKHIEQSWTVGRS